MKKILTCTALLSTVIWGGTVYGADLSPMESLGKMLYESNSLSLNETQSCATCHHSLTGFADFFNSAVSLGDDELSTGGRNAPTSAYCGFSPILHKDSSNEWVGGMFWDGRATGATLGDPLAEQAQGPPLNPVEMNMPDADTIIERISSSDSGIADDFVAVFGATAFDDVDIAYENLARAIAAYERSSEVTQFSSRFDMDDLDAHERRGLKVFKKNCANCHSVDVVPGVPGPLFTNYKYVNAGVPKNQALEDDPFCAYVYPDLGLGGFLGDHNQNGKFKVPTLRNIELTAPYSHNGYFVSLEEMVAFMNDNSTYTPEVKWNLSNKVGNLNLNSGQLKDVVAFLRTLTDN